MDDVSHRIGIFEVVPSRNVLIKDDEIFSLEPRIMDVLCALAMHRGKVLTRCELIEQLWGVHFGGDESLSRAISKIRKTLKDAGVQEQYIETIPKRGYRLIQPTEGFAPEANKPELFQPRYFELPFSPSSIDELKPQLSPPEGYSVAVTPLECLGDKESKLLCEEIGSDLVGMLSHDPFLRVPAYSTKLKREVYQSDAIEIGHSLSVNYIVSGTLVSRNGRFKLRLSLISATDNRHILSWRLDEDANQFTVKLDEFVLGLSTSIISEIQIEESSRIHSASDEDIHWHSRIQSIEMLRRRYSEKRAHQIVDHLCRLIHREPNNAVALASLGAQLAQNVVSSWTRTPVETMALAESYIRRALGITPGDPHVLMSAGILAAMQRDCEAAVCHLSRSMNRNPNNPHALAMLGWQKCLLDPDSEGIAMICTAERWAPHHPRFSSWAHYRGICEMKLGHLEEAALAYRQASDRNTNFFLPHLMSAAVLAMLNRDDQARVSLARSLNIAPRYSFQNLSDLLDDWVCAFPDVATKDECASAAHRIWSVEAHLLQHQKNIGKTSPGNQDF